MAVMSSMVLMMANKILQLKFVEIAGGIKAVVWAVDIWKDAGGGRWDSNYDLFTELLTPLLVSF